MGGSIRVESQIGEGTSFIITLQARCPKPDSQQALRDFEQSSEEIFVFASAQIDDENDQILENDSDQEIKYRILLVNDEAFQLYAYKLQLETQFEVEVAENGFKALQQVRTRPKDFYDAIVLDLNMPIMDGYEACSLIYNYLNNIDDNLHSATNSLKERLDLRVSKTLIYSLSSDFAPETIEKVRLLPFDGSISNLGEKETTMLFKKIEKS